MRFVELKDHIRSGVVVEDLLFNEFFVFRELACLSNATVLSELCYFLDVASVIGFGSQKI
jgi:hypothetical protein